MKSSIGNNKLPICDCESILFIKNPFQDDNLTTTFERISYKTLSEVHYNSLDDIMLLELLHLMNIEVASLLAKV